MKSTTQNIRIQEKISNTMWEGGKNNISKNNFYNYILITKRNVNNCILLKLLKITLVVTL